MRSPCWFHISSTWKLRLISVLITWDWRMMKNWRSSWTIDAKWATRHKLAWLLTTTAENKKFSTFSSNNSIKSQIKTTVLAQALKIIVFYLLALTKSLSHTITIKPPEWVYRLGGLIISDAYKLLSLPHKRGNLLLTIKVVYLLLQIKQLLVFWNQVPKSSLPKKNTVDRQRTTSEGIQDRSII